MRTLDLITCSEDPAFLATPYKFIRLPDQGFTVEIPLLKNRFSHYTIRCSFEYKKRWDIQDHYKIRKNSALDSWLPGVMEHYGDYDDIHIVLELELKGQKYTHHFRLIDFLDLAEYVEAAHGGEIIPMLNLNLKTFKKLNRRLFEMHDYNGDFTYCIKLELQERAEKLMCQLDELDKQNAELAKRQSSSHILYKRIYIDPDSLSPSGYYKCSSCIVSFVPCEEKKRPWKISICNSCVLEPMHDKPFYDIFIRSEGGREIDAYLDDPIDVATNKTPFLSLTTEEIYGIIRSIDKVLVANISPFLN